jgi:serine/threonine protein kinase
MYETALGLSVLHELIPRAVLHRDLKAANVLLSTALPPPSQLLTLLENGALLSDSCVAKVADFGIAEIMETVASRASASGGVGVAGGRRPHCPSSFPCPSRPFSFPFPFPFVPLPSPPPSLSLPCVALAVCVVSKI